MRYSLRALGARTAFYSPYNDVNIIVEDETLENFYTELFGTLLGNAFRIGRVLGVGGKDAVLNRFNALKDNPGYTHEFYLLDGDFDELLGRHISTHPRLYRLSRYDIEGFIVEREAVAHVAQQENPRKNFEDYMLTLQCDQFLHDISISVQRLIACFVLLRKLGVSTPGGRSSIDRFVADSGILPDEDKIGEFVKLARQAQTLLDDEEFDFELEQIRNQMGHSHSQIRRWISGKDVVLPLIGRLLRREAGYNLRLESLRFRLLEFCELDELAHLRMRIVEIYS